MHEPVLSLDEERPHLARAEHVDREPGVHAGERLAVRGGAARAHRGDEAAHVEAASEHGGVARQDVQVEGIREHARRPVHGELVQHAGHDRLGPEARVLPRVQVEPRPLEAIVVARVACAAGPRASLRDPQHRIAVGPELAREGSLVVGAGFVADPRSSGGTGDILLTTAGALSGATYDITIGFKKRSN